MVTLRNLGDGPLAYRIVVVDSTDSFVVASGGGVGSLAGGTRRNVLVAFRPGERAKVAAELELGTGCPAIDLLGEGDDPPECDVSRGNVDFGTVTIGTSRLEHVTITNTGGGLLEGALATTCGDVVIELPSLTYALGRDESLEVPLRFTPDHETPIDCTLLTGGCGDVALTGVGEIVIGCALSRDFLALESRVGGTGDTGTVIVSNTGFTSFSGVVSISGSSRFAVTRGLGGFTLPPSGTHRIDVAFTPGGECGESDATISLGTGDCDTVTLTGTAYTTFDDDIAPLFDVRGCLACHGSGSNDWSSYESVVSHVSFSNPPGSRMLTYPWRTDHGYDRPGEDNPGQIPCFNPSGGACYDAILCWIETGAREE